MITSLPLILNLFFNLKCKIILRISGFPKLNFIRKFLWKIALNKIDLITCPTESTLNTIKSQNLVENDKLCLLRDPVICYSLNKSKNEDLKGKKFYFAAGRFTRQKNFYSLVVCFSKFLKVFPNEILLIAGEGEDFKKIYEFIHKEKLQKKIQLVGYQENLSKFYKNSKCFILNSLWEDPGFVLLDAAYHNTPIISSDCPNGPKEILNFGQNGILFTYGSEQALIDSLIKFENLDKKTLNKFVIQTKKVSKKFSYYSHFKSFKKILNKII